MKAEAIAQAASAVFERLGGGVIDPPGLMPALLPLELSGEAVRARLCIFADAYGQEFALRPDLTLPVALAEIEARRAGHTGESLRRYNARAWRLARSAEDPVEFVQIGFERFGAPASAQTDAEAFAAVLDAARVSGVDPDRIRLGDLAIFPAFVDALDLAPETAQAVKRAFRQQGGVQALISGAGDGDLRGGQLARQLRGADAMDAEAIVMDMLALSGVTPVGERGVDEIAERLAAKGSQAGARAVPQAAGEVLSAVLAIDETPEKAVEALTALARKAGRFAPLEQAIESLKDRLEAISEGGSTLAADARFSAAYGRRFNYYDGFLFELFATGAGEHRPFGAGGRYDGLLGRLSRGEVSSSAVGGVVRPDRLEQAAGAIA